jgi:hypothetical protein
MAQKVSFPKIIAALEQHCQAKHTGTLRVLADKGVSAAFLLDSGRIVAVQCSNHEGEQALEKIVTIQNGVVKFMEGSLQDVSSAPLLSNEAIFQCLLGQGSGSVPTSEGAGAGKPLTAGHKTLLEDLLADQIGPMAQIICGNVFSSVSDTQTATAALAQEIPDPAMRKQFLAAAQKKL